MQTFYYTRTSRKVTMALLDMFNSMEVYNYSSATSYDVVSIIKVPIKFGVPDKAYLFNLQQASGKKYYPKIPAILINLENITYNPDRASSVNEVRSFYDSQLDISQVDQFWENYQPAPYDLSFKMVVVTESMDHTLQIMENILPYFNPTNYLRIKEFDFLNLERNLRVELTNTYFEYPESMSEEESRYFKLNISLNVQAVLYRPIDYTGIIKYIKTGFYYDGFNREQFNTSGVPTSAVQPTDYNYSFPISSSATGYTKIKDLP